MPVGVGFWGRMSASVLNVEVQSREQCGNYHHLVDNSLLEKAPVYNCPVWLVVPDVAIKRDIPGMIQIIRVVLYLLVLS